jgi:hypothetical protein
MTESLYVSSCGIVPADLGLTPNSRSEVFRMAFTKEDDISEAAAAGEGWIEVTGIVVRCPLIDFSNLR